MIWKRLRGMSKGFSERMKTKDGKVVRLEEEDREGTRGGRLM